MSINYIDISITICDFCQVTPVSEEFESKVEQIFKKISVPLCLMLEQYMKIYEERYDWWKQRWKRLFWNFPLYLEGCHFSTKRFKIVKFGDILHLEINFWNLYYKRKVFHKAFGKYVVKATTKKLSLKKTCIILKEPPF